MRSEVGSVSRSRRACDAERFFWRPARGQTKRQPPVPPPRGRGESGVSRRGVPMVSRGVPWCLVMYRGVSLCLVVSRGASCYFVVFFVVARGVLLCFAAVRDDSWCLVVSRGVSRCLVVSRGVSWVLVLVFHGGVS